MLDISNPTKPVLVGSIFTSDDATSVYVHGNIAYLSGSGGLHIIDVTTPSSPVKVGFLDPLSDTDSMGIHFYKDHIYLAREPHGLFIIDVSDPSSPQIVRNYRRENNYETSVADVFVLNDYAYFTAPGDEAHIGFYVLDVGNPSNPKEISSVAMSDPPTSVHVVENHAYVTGFRSGLHVFDITDPSTPIEVSTFDIRNMDYGAGAQVDEVYIYEGYAFMTLRGSGFLILDVKDPLNPVEVDRIDSTEGFGIYAYSGYLYVADLDYGLRIFDIEQLLGE